MPTCRDSYTIDLSPYDFDWKTAIAASGIECLSLDGQTLHVSKPLASSDLSVLEGKIEDRAIFDRLYQRIYEAQEKVVSQYEQGDLDEWVAGVVFKRRWFPLLSRADDRHVASALREIFDNAIDTDKPFAGRLKTAVESVILSVSFDLPVLDPSVLREILLLSGYFGVQKAGHLLRSVIEDDRFDAMDVGGTRATVLAVRVLAGLADDTTIAVLRGMLRDPQCTVACFEGLVHAFPASCADFFWVAATAVCERPDDARLYAICNCLLSHPLDPVIPWLAGLLRELFGARPSLAVHVLKPLLECLLKHPTLARIERSVLSSNVEISGIFNIMGESGGKAPVPHGRVSLLLDVLSKYGDQLHLRDPATPDAKPEIVLVPPTLTEHIPPDIRRTEISPTLPLASVFGPSRSR